MSLSGNLGGGLVEIRESPSIHSTGSTTITQLGNGQFHIDSFFDVFTELSVDGGTSFIASNDPAKMELLPPPGAQKHDSFFGDLMQGGGMQGGGTGWNDGQWIEYPDDPNGDPQRPWYNQWFYNDPLDTDRYKEIFWDITVEPLDPTGAGGGDIVDVAINWSNDLYPDGTGQPPMPDQENFIERQIIWPGTGTPGDVEFDPATGTIHLKNRPEDGDPFIISDYNPEWVSIDVRFADGTIMQDVTISGEIWHECVPEPTTMTFLALGGLAVLRRRRKQ